VTTEEEEEGEGEEETRVAKFSLSLLENNSDEH